MFGPLPLLYRVLLVLCVLAVMGGGGAWLAHSTPLPVAVRAGALLGVAVGVGLSFLLVHDFTHAARPARVPRRHH